MLLQISLYWPLYFTALLNDRISFSIRPSIVSFKISLCSEITASFIIAGVVSFFKSRHKSDNSFFFKQTVRIIKDRFMSSSSSHFCSDGCSSFLSRNASFYFTLNIVVKLIVPGLLLQKSDKTRFNKNCELRSKFKEKNKQRSKSEFHKCLFSS